MTLSIPYTITSGFTPVVEQIGSIWAPGSSSVSGGTIVVTIVNPYVTYSLFGPGGARLNVPIIYLDSSPGGAASRSASPSSQQPSSTSEGGATSAALPTSMDLVSK